MPLRKFIHLLICTLLFSLLAYSERALRFERLSIENGLSQSTVFTIIQDRSGFLWLGTEDGLNRYNGYTFTTFRNNPDNSGSISSNWIQSLYQDSSGFIWIGTDSCGLNRFDPVAGTFNRYRHEPGKPDTIGTGMVWAISEGKPGELWLATDDGLYRMHTASGKFRCWRHKKGSSKGLSGNRIKAICPDGRGGFWLGIIGGGLNHFFPNKLEEDGASITRYTARPNGPGNAVYSLQTDTSGILWIGCGNGLFALDTGSGRFLDLDQSQNKRFKALTRFKNSIVIALKSESEPDVLWVGTYGQGLYRFDRMRGTLEHFQHSHDSHTSLSCNYVQTIFRDRQGATWIGTDNGLNRFDVKKQRFGHWKVESGNTSGLSNNNILALCKDKSGILWIGTEEGLDRIDRNGGSSHKYKRLTGPGSNESVKVNCIYEDENGILWVGTFGQGVFQLDKKNGGSRWYRENKNPSSSYGLSDNRIHSICSHPGNEGDIWIGTAKGLDHLNPVTRVITRYTYSPEKPDCISNSYINILYPDRTGRLWIGTQGGLNCLEKKETGTFTCWTNKPGDVTTLSNDHITSICQDMKEDKYLWIGTLGGGLNRFDTETGTFKHYLYRYGLTNGNICGILGDKDGNLWLSSNRGLWKFDTSKETFKNYDARDGLQANEFNAGAYYRSPDGELFFGGVNGFNAFYPRRIIDNPHIPPVVVTGFSILNKPVSIGGKSPLKQSITHTGEIRLYYRDYFFSFDFAALDYTNPDKNRYAYKMEGFDPDWIDTGADKRFASYTNLDPGEYIFRVTGSNNDGTWNKKGASIHITIVPPYWRTWWFTILMLLGFAVFSYLAIGFVKKYLTMTAFWKREKYIGKYKLLEKIGSGGMGTIYKARDTMDNNRLVAIKVLRDELFEDEVHRRRFKQEAAIIDQLDHPNIIRVIERGQHKQKLFIAMELLDGINLTRRIAESPMIPMREVLEIMIQIMAALLKIHRHNIVHRDLKPDNIMLMEGKDGRTTAKLLDFGLAKTRFQTRITQTGTVLGTINYLSPEQISKAEFSPASDLYAMGVIFYETVTHQVPFPGERITDIMKNVMLDEPVEPIRLRPDLPIAFNDLIMSLLNKKPEDRPKGEDILIDLRHILATLPPPPNFEVTQKMEKLKR